MFNALSKRYERLISYGLAKRFGLRYIEAKCKSFIFSAWIFEVCNS